MAVQVPKSAPSVQAIQTGKGQAANVPGSGTPPGLKPPPKSAGSTKYIENGPSVNYHAGQPPPPKVVDAGTV